MKDDGSDVLRRGWLAALQSGSGTELDEGLQDRWHQKLRGVMAAMRGCGPLEAMQKLDGLVREAALEGTAEDARALSLAWVRALASPAPKLSMTLVRSAGSLGLQAAAGPLLAHVYSRGFWPGLKVGDPVSEFTDLQRRAIVRALADLRVKTLFPALGEWFSRGLAPLWKAPPPGLGWLFGRGQAGLFAVETGTDRGRAVAGLTLRELRSHGECLGKLVEEDQVKAWGQILDSLRIPISDGSGERLRWVAGELAQNFFAGWLQVQEPAAWAEGQRSRFAERLPAPWCHRTDFVDSLVQAASAEGDLFTSDDRWA